MTQKFCLCRVARTVGGTCSGAFSRKGRCQHVAVPISAIHCACQAPSLGNDLATKALFGSRQDEVILTN